jgi:hypothetical protein
VGTLTPPLESVNSNQAPQQSELVERPYNETAPFPFQADPNHIHHILMNGTNAGRSLRASVQLDAIVPVSALVISLDYVPAI